MASVSSASWRPLKSVVALQQLLDVPTLGDLALQVDVQLVDRPLDHLELVDQEVGRVAFVGLGFQEGPLVLRRGFAENREIGRYSASQ